jgi:paraquat-inducible protein A
MKSISLRSLYPWWRQEVPLLIGVSCLLLAAGLLLPLMHVQKMVLWKNEYSVTTGVISLWEQGERLLAAVVFFFSVIFPIVKLVSLAIIWLWPLSDQYRQSVLHWLGILGKWSMLDVFAVAILIVLVKLGPLARIEPQAGVYAFALAIILSMLTTMYVTRLARRK